MPFLQLVIQENILNSYFYIHKTFCSKLFELFILEIKRYNIQIKWKMLEPFDIRLYQAINNHKLWNKTKDYIKKRKTTFILSQDAHELHYFFQKLYRELNWVIATLIF